MSGRMGRPPTYESDDERPVTISVKAPRELYGRLKQYAYTHRQSVTELVLDGIRMRLDTPADPREMILSDDNTVSQEVQEMIDAAVRLALSAQGIRATPEAPHPLRVELPSYDNTVIPKQPQASPPVAAEDLETSPASRNKGGRKLSARGQAILRLLGAHPNGLTNAQIKVNLHIDSKAPIHDLLDGMVKRGKLRKDTTGPELRYFA